MMGAILDAEAWTNYARTRSSLIANVLVLKWREAGYHAKVIRSPDGSYLVLVLLRTSHVSGGVVAGAAAPI